MFTGLVQATAMVARIDDAAPGKRLALRETQLAASAAIGDSIAVSGCCLTVVARDENLLSFEAGPETLARTTLGALRAGDIVNLERSLAASDTLGGHLVTGHVDDVGALVERHDDGQWSTCWFSAPSRLLRQMAPKGSVAIDGVSLTLVEVTHDRFSVALIPHTLAVTTLGRLQIGGRVNLETDLLAKYVERQLAWVQEQVTQSAAR